MTTPFTTEQFFAVFASYNVGIWPAQVVAYCIGLVAVAAVWQQRPRPSQLTLLILALMWLWNAIGYHHLFFAAINPAANLFAALFIVEALLLAGRALSNQNLTFRVGRDFRSAAGCAVIVYALFVYPTLGLWAGHGLMAGPMFGVAPCPTTIFTIGLLLLARGRWVIWLSVIPVLWSLVGLAAALQLGIREDLALPMASLALVVILIADAGRAGHATDLYRFRQGR